MPALNRAVNKRHMSTGEIGDFATEFLGSRLNPGGEARTPARPRFQSERSAATNLFEMFGLKGKVEGAGVKKTGRAS